MECFVALLVVSSWNLLYNPKLYSNIWQKKVAWYNWCILDCWFFLQSLHGNRKLAAWLDQNRKNTVCWETTIGNFSGDIIICYLNVISQWACGYGQITLPKCLQISDILAMRFEWLSCSFSLQKAFDGTGQMTELQHVFLGGMNQAL